MMEKLVAMIVEQLGVNAADVKPESRLKEDLQADSASIMMLVMDVENEFGIEVEDDAIEKVKTVSDMVSYIEAKM
ncbi:MAG: acyl carrier protein [Clostridiales bacterium]|nr:acyl carrier protein [Clostridiales bacterium]